MHTNIFPDQVTDSDGEARVFATCRRRSEFLSKKILADLENGEKIFVYQNYQILKDDQVRELFDVLSDFGPNTLLIVQPADAERPAGSIETIQPGLMIGRLERFFGLGIRESDLDWHNWLQLCRSAFTTAQQWRRNTLTSATSDIGKLNFANRP
jgi:hypothetical protein